MIARVAHAYGVWEDAFGVEHPIRGCLLAGCPATYWEPGCDPEWDAVEVKVAGEWIPCDDEHLAEVCEILDDGIADPDDE